MTAWLQLWRQAIRGLARHPLFSAFAIVTLAVAIGGGTLVFSLYDAIAFRALPVERPHELVSVRDLAVDSEGRVANVGRLSLEDFKEMQAAAGPIATLAAYAEGRVVLRAGDRTEEAGVQWVDSGYFETLGVRAVRGRTFGPGDDPRNGGTGGVVITEKTWTRLFDRDGGVTNRSISVNGVAEPILGVAPGGFSGFDVGDEPVLFGLASDAPPEWAAFQMLARLGRGTTATRLEARLAAAHDAIRAAEPGRRTFMMVGGRTSESKEKIQVVDGSRGESRLRGEAALPIALVGGLLALVLVVLAGNLAILLAVRALAERRTAAIRLALGAPPAVVAGGWLAESLVLALGGALLGLVGVGALGESLLSLAPLPGWAHGIGLSLDVRTIAVAAGLAVTIAVLVGGLAAWEHARVLPQLRLREEASTVTGVRGRLRLRNALIASQVALSVVLLIAMGLFVRSAAALLAIDTGFPLERVETFRVDIPDPVARQAGPELLRLRQEIAALPGVSAAGFSASPVLGGVRSYVTGAVEGYEPAAGEVMMLNAVAVSPGFFESLDTPLARGRFFDDADVGRGTRSVIVNRPFAERYFRGDPIGRRISFNFMRGDWREPRPDDLAVVGVVDDRVVSDVREEPAPRIYPLSTGGSGSVVFYVRTPGNPMLLAPTIERLVRERMPEAAVVAPRTLADQRDLSLRRELLTRDLTLVFGAAAAALAALGLFAIVSYQVGERRREFGLRQALGATPNMLVRQVVADGLRPVLWGLAAGVALAAVLGRVAASQLYGVTPRDPVAFVAAFLSMGAFALAACLPAAFRASRTDPAKALRS